MKVLIADDTGKLAARGVIFLAMWGHETRVVSDGLKALREARAWRPDVVLAETRLERMGGLALCAALSAGPDTRSARTILVGPDDDGHLAGRALALGAEAFLPAPLSLPDLQRVVQRLANVPAGAEPRAAVG